MTKKDRPKLFVSSTCYDLAAVRDAIHDWAASEGYEPQLSDRASFPVDAGQHRHDVCIANAALADLAVVVVAGRLGAPYVHDTSISVTWAEFRAAIGAGCPVVGFCKRDVWDEREQYRKDPNATLQHTKDPRTFDFLSEIQSHSAGVWIEMFDTPNDVVERLAALRPLPSMRPPLPPTGVVVEREKRVLTSSLSPSAYSHVRLVVGDNEWLDDYDVYCAIAAIPELSEVRDEVVAGLNGFTVRATQTQDGRYLVRPTIAGIEVRSELEGVSLLIYPA